MAYTTTQLITGSFYKSGIRSPSFDTVLGPDISQGLAALNKILARKTLDIGEIPYFNRFIFNDVAGQGEYFIPKLITVDTLTFFINGVRYSTGEQSRAEFFGSPRATNISSLPFNWHLERCFGGANLFLYFEPDSAYPMEIWGLFRLDQVVLGQDLEATIDLFYIDVLEFQLAERLCIDYGFSVPVEVTNELERIYNVLDKQSGQMDTKAMRVTTLDNTNDSLNYADVNIGHGWRP